MNKKPGIYDLARILLATNPMGDEINTVDMLRYVGNQIGDVAKQLKYIGDALHNRNDQ